MSRLFLVLRSKSSPTYSDITGFLSDLGITLLITALILTLNRLNRFLSLPILILWCLFHYSNYEHVRVNGGIVSLSYAQYLLNPEFLFGSALTISSIPLLVLSILLTGSAVIVKSRRLHWFTTILPASAGVLILFFIQSLSSVMEERWRTTNVIPANLYDLAQKQSRLHRSQKTVNSSRYLESQLHGDITGKRLFTRGKAGNNVLIVVLEGVNGGVLAAVKQQHGLNWPISMPAFDSISSQNMVFTNHINHQRQTNRGLFSILTGQYPKLNSSTPKMTEFINFPINILTLPCFLKEHGYETAYLQASPLPYMLKDIFMKKAGFTECLGKNWFKRFYSSKYWGIDDKAFFEQSFTYLKSLNERRRPWFATMLTVGTHHPLDNVPETYRRIPGESAKQRVYAYLDEALQQFLLKLKKNGILDNTLVIITSDESQAVKGFSSGAAERLSQQLGLLTILHPGRHQAAIHRPTAQRDIALSIADHLDLTTPEPPFAGRSLFRSYVNPRKIYFANTYCQVSGCFNGVNELDICSENFLRCERYNLEESLFRGKLIIGNEMPSDEIDELAEFAWTSNNQILGSDTAKTVKLDFYSGKEHKIPPGPQLTILGGQFFTLPEMTEVKVHLHGRIIRGNKSRVFLKHDLYGKALKSKIVKFVYKTLSERDGFSVDYTFYNFKTYFSSEFRFTAELKGGNTAYLIIDEAVLTYEKRPPTQEENKMALKRFDRKVGRDLGIFMEKHSAETPHSLAKK